MNTTTIEDFLALYPPLIQHNARLLRQVILRQLPAIGEQLDLPAKMIAYSYSPSYADLICVILPSKKGLKLGFNKGPEIPDPEGLLQGTAKTTRYITINNSEQIQAPEITRLLTAALDQYKKERRIPENSNGAADIELSVSGFIFTKTIIHEPTYHQLYRCVYIDRR